MTSNDVPARPSATDSASTVFGTARPGGDDGTAGHVTVGRIVSLLDQWYPPRLAESWDCPGLVCGDPKAPVTHVACALEATDEVVEAALRAGAGMLVVHHPLLMRGVTSVAADTPKGRIVHRLISGGTALMSAHTNADAAIGGVNDVLARLLGVVVDRPLQPADEGIDLWGVQVPVADADRVEEAMFEAGAGHIGHYDRCSFRTDGRGRFRPLPGANPTLGRLAEDEQVAETRLHLVAPRSLRAAVTAALMRSHPYEAPAFDVLPAHTGSTPGPGTAGIGRVGHLPEPMTLADFTQRVADRLPRTVWGIRAAGDPDLTVRTVALCSGAGDSLLANAAASGADVYLTSDLRHHPADEHLRAGGPALIDTAHWASESPWCADLARRLHEALGVRTTDLAIRTDPWTIGASPSR